MRIPGGQREWELGHLGDSLAWDRQLEVKREEGAQARKPPSCHSDPYGGQFQQISTKVLS